MKYFNKMFAALVFASLVACDNAAKWAFKPVEPGTPDLFNTLVPNDEIMISVMNDSIAVGGLRNAEIRVMSVGICSSRAELIKSN